MLYLSPSLVYLHNTYRAVGVIIKHVLHVDICCCGIGS